MSEEQTEPRVLPRADHPISRRKIPRNALKVLYRLHRSGHKGYLVGGSVRDLMLEGEPKDFDAATDARPAQIRKLFRNSRIIGRRFRLAHVFFSDGIIEVATFRREPSPEEQKSGPDELLITSDNTFGSPREDAFRRDFTINALFYDIGDFSVIDYVGGIEDLEDEVIRCIGDPEVRFREDPVRMLRACEFAARLGFSIEEGTQEGILAAKDELSKASSARMTEELIQLLRCGRAAGAIEWMLEVDLVDVFIPEVKTMLKGSGPAGDLSQMLPVLDEMVMKERQLTDSTLLATLLLPKVLVERIRIEEGQGRRLNKTGVEKLVNRCVDPFLARFSLSNAKTRALIEALIGFQQLCETRWSEKRRQSFAGRRCFRDSLDLFELMVNATGEGQDVLDRWRKVRPARRKQSEEEGSSRPRRRRRRRRRKGRRSNDSQSRAKGV